MKTELSAICFASMQTKTIQVLLSSIEAYVPPEVELYFNLTDSEFEHQKTKRAVKQFAHQAKNYGDAYNFIVNKTFEEHENIIVCNDDVVFTPTTYELLTEDFNSLHKTMGTHRLGWLGCLTDYAIGLQNIRRNVRVTDDQETETFGDIHNFREQHIIEVSFIAPICAAITKSSWVDYLPINYFSDNLQCWEMSAQGKRHFVSTSYVHHVGSQSISDTASETQIALQRLQADYPQYYKIIQSMRNEVHKKIKLTIQA